MTWITVTVEGIHYSFDNSQLAALVGGLIEAKVDECMKGMGEAVTFFPHDARPGGAKCPRVIIEGGEILCDQVGVTQRQLTDLIAHELKPLIREVYLSGDSCMEMEVPFIFRHNHRDEKLSEVFFSQR